MGLVEITCADCGCRVDRGRLIAGCDDCPNCCCGHLGTDPDGVAAPARELPSSRSAGIVGTPTGGSSIP
jgi:hypothetical protein